MARARRTTDIEPDSTEAPIGIVTPLVLGLMAAMAPLATDLHLPGLPDIADSLDSTDAAAAATITVCFAGFAVGGLVVGGLSDRYGRRGPTLVCLAVLALTGAMCALAPTMEVLLIARFLQGFFGAGSVIASRASVRDLVQGSAASGLYSQLAMITMIAPVIAPILGGQVLRFTTWRGLFWVFTVITLALLVVAVVLMKETLPPEQRRRGGPGQLRIMLAVTRHHGFGQHMVLSLGQGLILISYLTMSALFLRESYDVGAQTYSYLFAAVGSAMMAAHFVNVRVAPRWGALNMLTASVVCYFAGTVILAAAVLSHAPLPFVIAGLLITIPSLAPSMPNNMALALIPLGAAAGTASALLGSTQQLAGAIFPSITVHLGNTGNAMALTMLAGAVIGIVQIFAVVRPALQRGPRPDFEAVVSATSTGNE